MIDIDLSWLRHIGKVTHKKYKNVRVSFKDDNGNIIDITAKFNITDSEHFRFIEKNRKPSRVFVVKDENILKFDFVSDTKFIHCDNCNKDFWYTTGRFKYCPDCKRDVK